MINRKHHDIEAADLIAEGRRFGLSVQKGKALLNDTVQALSCWQDVFADCEVREAHTGRLRREIARRLFNFGNTIS